MAVFNDANLEKAYQNIYGQLQGSGGYTPLSMPEQTLDSITEQLAGTLRPQYEQAISKLYGLTKEQKARIDVDAASRGMTSSSIVTDLKNRAMNSLSEQIRGIETDYAAQLANDALNQYQNYLGDKLALDQYNQKLEQALGDDAYARTMQQLSAGLVNPVSKGSGSGTKPNGKFYANGQWWDSEQKYLDWVKDEEEKKRQEALNASLNEKARQSGDIIKSGLTMNSTRTIGRKY